MCGMSKPVIVEFPTTKEGYFNMSITKAGFGTTRSGEAVELYTLTSKGGAFVEIITYGGAIRSICVPDSDGALGDVALGYDTLAEYEQQGGYLGALIGRVGNRIERGEFTLNGESYKLYCNNGGNHLHGGKTGFNARVWAACEKGGKLELTYHSPDGEEGYPGALDVTVTYGFSDDNELTIAYTAVSDKDTIINLTNHCYFNLAGQGNGTVLNHELILNGGQYCENNAECFPTGVLAPVEGTPFDFKEFHAIGERMGADNEQVRLFGGYDHNFVINRSTPGLVPTAELWEKGTGRLMSVSTTKPGVQLYTGNGLDASYPGKGGIHYKKHAGLCLETQFFPNAMKYPHFSSPILRAGQPYHHTTVYRFGTQK